MALGRPTKYDPALCDKLIEHMSKGFSFESFGAEANCTEETLHQWKHKYPDFSESYKRGSAISRRFWEDLGIVGTTEGNHFNATSWIFNMKNRFKWVDRHDVTSDGEKLEAPHITLDLK